MQTIKHPVSGTSIEGYLLGPDAVIKATDMYACGDGTWQLAPCEGAMIQRGCQMHLVRCEEVSREALELLRTIIERGYFLTAEPYWRMLPSPGAITDDRIDWHVSREAGVELVSWGFVATRGFLERDVLEPTGAGRRALE